MCIPCITSPRTCFQFLHMPFNLLYKCPACSACYMSFTCSQVQRNVPALILGEVRAGSRIGACRARLEAVAWEAFLPGATPGKPAFNRALEVGALDAVAGGREPAHALGQAAHSHAFRFPAPEAVLAPWCCPASLVQDHMSSGWQDVARICSTDAMDVQAPVRSGCRPMACCTAALHVSATEGLLGRPPVAARTCAGQQTLTYRDPAAAGTLLGPGLYSPHVYYPANSERLAQLRRRHSRGAAVATVFLR